MPLHEGENVGPYRVIGQLGQGGMATVYKAYHAQLNRYVAIKMMHHAFQDNQNFLARFRREAQIVALLEHPHIVPVYDFSEYQNQPYLVMKFIEGKTLKGTLVDGALTLEQVLHVMTAVANALTYAHSKGVLHRDIKPSNIVIDKDNVPYLTDFGLARIAEAGESTLSADMIMGTPHYISPEQALGEKNLTAGTDIYSLGVVLYELVVGRVPFSADTPYAIIHDHIYTPLPLPSQVNPDIPANVEMVLLKALAKDPQDRYASAVAMVEAFKTAVTSAGLSELRADRVSLAGISLAKLRIAMNSQLIAGSTPNLPGIAAPIPLPSPSQIMRQRRRERRWLWGGFVAFLLLCGLSGLITVSAGGTLARLSEARQDGELPLVPPPLANVGGYQVPDIPLDIAQTAVARNPNDPAMYLAVARALNADGQSSAARAAFEAGLAIADDRIGYLMTAGNLMAEDENHESAIVLYLAALQLARENPLAYPDVRAHVGHYLYELTSQPNNVNFTALRLSLNSPELNQIDPSFLHIFGSYNLLNFERPTLALGRIRPLATRPDALAEARLVYGEAFLADNQPEQAREQWTIARDDPHAPQWVRDRAEELISDNP
ncbi:MAG: serine/threonine protein kinase [Chloroflexi bacterium]|nr:serine/threonine protein kinase [Chloroflexota bacterium]